MPQPRHATNRAAYILFAAIVFLISVVLTASRGASAQQGHLIPPQSPPMSPMGYKILSPTEGVDFLPYLTTLFGPLERNFVAKKPKSTNGEGKEAVIVVVRVQIQKDGSLTEGAVTIASSSGNDDVDAAAVSAIRKAAPFARLPEEYSGAYLELEVSFYFKNEPPEQKPKLVPVKPLEAV
jgi:TonB family protein